jgi:hypothetical protein
MGSGTQRTTKVRAAIGSALVLLATLTVGISTVSAAPPVPFTVSPTSLSLAASAGDYDYDFVTVTTGKKSVVIENTASFGSGVEFFDTQAGTCWQSYGVLGLRVPANTSCTIQVGFHPSAAGSSTDVMTVYACKKSHVDAGSGQMVCDARDGSRTVDLTGAATPAACSYTAGTSGCIVLTNVEITDSSSSATYTLSGQLTFTPTCQNGVGGCSYVYPNILITGSGTFTVSGSQTASGTWTVPAQPNDHPESGPYQFTDSGFAATTCALAVIRQITVNTPLIAGNGDIGGQVLSIRTDSAGTSSRVSATFSTGPLPTGTFNNPFNSQAGVTILC